VEKYRIAGETTDKNMVQAHCMLDDYGYKHTLRLCNTYCFSSGNNGYANAPQYYVIRTLPVLLQNGFVPSQTHFEFYLHILGYFDAILSCCFSCELRNGQATLHGRSDGFLFKTRIAGKIIRDQMLFRGRH